MTIDRRSFLARGAVAAGSAAMAGSLFTTLDLAGASASPAATGGRAGRRDASVGYGPLQRRPDQDGNEVLALPEGFSYVTFSRTGDRMSDGTPTPRAHDGMAAFASSRRDSVVLVRNHEVRTAPGTVENSVIAPEAVKYDPLGVGGTVSVLFDTRAQALVRDHVSFAGSHTNCAGGISYRDVGWITCEESVAGPNQGWGRKHGYAFLVRALARSAEASVPLTAMGRFAHEAVAVDPYTGLVYETEDDGNDSGFYRFTPNNPGKLHLGGTLEMLAVTGRPGYDAKTGQTVGTELDVSWVRIEDPDPDLEAGAPGVAAQGLAGGAALFNRLEGIWWDNRSKGFFFVSTSGGDAGYGQVWHYHPRRQKLRLFFESPGGSVLDSPDNLLVTPRHGVLLCEDNASPAGGGGHPLAPGIEDVNRLVGLDRSGRPFEFALNTMSDSELCGATFSPDGSTLFVNIQGGAEPGSGLTAAITGPWRRGPL
jgi:uncharacterized protein